MDSRPADFATTVFRAQPSEGLQRKIQKRNRPPVSCLLCRTRKVKCDRQQPCERCVKSGEAKFCEYAPRAARKPRAESRPQHDVRHKPEVMSKPLLQVRLQKLEDMVSGFLNPSASSATAREAPPLNTPSSSDQHTESESRSDWNSPPATLPPGQQPMMPTPQIADNSYVGATHWASILESIHDIKDIIGNESEDPPSPSPPPQADTDLVFGKHATTTHEQAVARIPARQRTDQLVLSYFRSKINVTKAPYIHTQKFQREYDLFWRDPSSASFFWISCLASILWISSTSNIARGEPCDPSDPAHPDNLKLLATSCLVAGDYLSGKPYSIEALLLHGYTEMHENTDIESGLWARFGLLTRLAQRMGYHRDPSYLKNLSPFEGEMRRRVWLLIEVFDVVYSFQLGVPPIVRDDECDTEPPSNLHDSDFDENIAILPPSRPITDLASTLYMTYKSKLCRFLRRVIRYNTSVSWPPYDKILALNNEIRDFHDGIPPPLQIRSIRSYSFTDESADIMNRLMLEMLYLKTLCILHRPYLTREKDNPRCDVSRNICRDAALSILNLHVEYEEECRPGGRLCEDKHMLSTFTMQDFLIASMVLCLDLFETKLTSQAERTRKIEALGLSYKMWSDRKHISKDAAHACRIVGTILRKVSMKDSAITSHGTSPLLPPPPPPTRSPHEVGSLASLLNNDTAPPEPMPRISDQTSLIPSMDVAMDLTADFPLDSVLGDPSMIDWNAIDQYVMHGQDYSGGLRGDF